MCGASRVNRECLPWGFEQQLSRDRGVAAMRRCCRRSYNGDLILSRGRKIAGMHRAYSLVECATGDKFMRGMDDKTSHWVRISPATDEERDWAAALMAASEPWTTLGVTLEECRRSCRDPEYLLYIAHTDAGASGMMLLHPRGVASSPYLKSIAVTGERRGEGIGAALLEFAEQLFGREAHFFFLCVSSFNHRARAFYERHGYTAVGEFKDYIIEGASEVLMQKRLR